MRAAVVLALAACDAGGGQEVSGEGRAISTLDQPPNTPLSRVSSEVARMLYEQNLISNPEVNREMNRAALRITKEGASPESVMPIFLRWLERWAATHPAQVEAARLAGSSYTPTARRLYADTDSTRKAQTDSIRLLVQARAKRRLELIRDSARRD